MNSLSMHCDSQAQRVVEAAEGEPAATQYSVSYDASLHNTSWGYDDRQLLALPVCALRLCHPTTRLDT